MKQYQVAVVRLQRKAQEDEDALTDILNERSRMGWNYHSMGSLEENRVALVFARDA
jgi:hypothetical protein